MKQNWQKILALVLVLAICATVIAVFAGCDVNVNVNNDGKEQTPANEDNKEQQSAEETPAALTLGGKGTISLVVAATEEGKSAKEYIVEYDKVTVTEGLVSVLNYLKENNGLRYTMTESSWGAYLTSLDNITIADGENAFVKIYTSVQEDADVSAYAEETTYGGVTVYYSGYGASSMHIQDGIVVYIVKGSY